MRVTEQEDTRLIPCNRYFSLQCLIAGLLCLWFAIPSQKSVATSDSQNSVQLITKSIEDIQIGDRTLGTNPLREQVDNTIEPDSSWKLIKLQLTKEDGKLLDVELLRPVEWLDFEEVKVGSTIYLDLPEMGAVGDALVKSIESALVIKQGEGNVVTGRFIHQAANCIDLQIEGQDKPIGCTANHPFWSEDRRDFIPAGQLNQGERVLLYNGDTARITQKLPRPGPETVYNLEIWGEHVYCVGEGGVLVHNQCSVGLPPLRQAYVNEVNNIVNVAEIAKKEGKNSEQIARIVHQLRREIGQKYKSLTPPEELVKITARNIDKYGDPLGPTIDYLRKQGKSWEDIIESASRTGGKDLGY